MLESTKDDSPTHAHTHPKLAVRHRLILRLEQHLSDDLKPGSELEHHEPPIQSRTLTNTLALLPPGYPHGDARLIDAHS